MTAKPTPSFSWGEPIAWMAGSLRVLYRPLNLFLGPHQASCPFSVPLFIRFRVFWLFCGVRGLRGPLRRLKDVSLRIPKAPVDPSDAPLRFPRKKASSAFLRWACLRSCDLLWASWTSLAGPSGDHLDLSTLLCGVFEASLLAPVTSAYSRFPVN